MKLKIKDDDQEETESEWESVAQLTSLVGILPSDVKKRVITIERPTEKTPGEKLFECFNQDSVLVWNNSTVNKELYEKAAKLFTDHHLARKDWMDPPRDWEERRTFEGEVLHAGHHMTIFSKDGLSYDCHNMLRWVGPSLLVRVTVDRLKAT